MKKIKLLSAIFSLSISNIALAQNPPPPLSQVDNPNVTTSINRKVNTIKEPAAPVIINGKKAGDLTDDEIKEFLEQKRTEISQDEGSTELVRIAPGYALSMSFDEPLTGVIMGDPKLVSYKLANTKLLVLSATQRSGDTNMQLVFPGNKILNYHVFIASNFVAGATAIKINTDYNPNTTSIGTSPYANSENIDVAGIVKVISNYDVMVQEKAINAYEIKRHHIAQKSDITSFTFFDLFQFKSGPAVITFEYTNPYSRTVRYDESRLRLQIGNVTYIPDYVSVNKTALRPGESTKGFFIVVKPQFSFKQTFELKWH